MKQENAECVRFVILRTMERDKDSHKGENGKVAIFAPFADCLQVALWSKADLRPYDVIGALGARAEAFAEQVHGAHTSIVREAVRYAPGADGLLTDVPGLALCVRWADCQSFIVFAPERNVLGTLHAGWRGLNAGAIPRFFQVLKQEWNIDPAETFVAAGPSLCLKCAGFTDPVRELPNIPSAFIQGKHADLRGAADAQLLELGVPPDHLERHPDCTCCHAETYWTYRGGDRDTVKKGHTNLLACALTVHS